MQAYALPTWYTMRQECHNSKFDIFYLFVQKETFADTLLTGIVS